MAGLLSELIAVPTENPPKRNYRVCADLLEKHIREFGLGCERFEPANLKNQNDDAPVCLQASFGTGDRCLYFHGHYDVVPAQSPEQFRPSRKEHFIFGRGSCDMKGGIVAMLYAILAIKECCGEKFKGNLGLTLVPDEETGGEFGSAWLAREGLLGRNAIGMLLAEPTSRRFDGRRMGRAWEKMTPEQREKFRQGVRSRWGDCEPSTSEPKPSA